VKTDHDHTLAVVSLIASPTTPSPSVPPRPAQLAASSWAFGGSKVHCLSPALRAGSPHLLRNPASPLPRRGRLEIPLLIGYSPEMKT